MDVAQFTAAGIRAAIERKHAEKAEAERRHREKQAAEHATLHESFEKQEVGPHAMERVMAVVQRAIELGEKEALVLRFPSDFMKDQGRSVTSHSDDWASQLTGFAARGAAWFRQELEPRGFRIRAAILDYDKDGIPGDVGLFLRWD
jgi:hypothetical protein